MPRVLLRMIGLALAFASMGLSLALNRDPSRKQKAIQRHSRWICKILGIRIHWQGQPPLHQPGLIIANHISYLDPFIIGCVLPTSFLGKSELAEWPILGRLGQLAGTIFVRRECMMSRTRALRRLKQAVAGLDSTYCIFPEGTTTSASFPLQTNWHRGHGALFKHSVRGVFCLSLHYRDQERIAWIDDQALVPHLFRLLALKRIDAFLVGEAFEGGVNASPVQGVASTFRTVSRLAEIAVRLNRHFIDIKRSNEGINVRFRVKKRWISLFKERDL